MFPCLCLSEFALLFPEVKTAMSLRDAIIAAKLKKSSLLLAQESTESNATNIDSAKIDTIETTVEAVTCETTEERTTTTEESTSDDATANGDDHLRDRMETILPEVPSGESVLLQTPTEVPSNASATQPVRSVDRLFDKRLRAVETPVVDPNFEAAVPKKRRISEFVANLKSGKTSFR